MNGDVSESVDLESGALDCKVYHVEKINISLCHLFNLLAQKYFDSRFGEKFVEIEHVVL